MSKFQISIFIA